MSLNMVRLPAFVVAALYEDALVGEIDQGNKSHDKEPLKVAETGISYTNKSLGDNLKNILIIVNNPGIEHLPDGDLNFLKGILAACKLSLADVAIINLANLAPSSYKALMASHKPKIVLLFDVPPADFGLPMNFPFYQIQPFAGSSFLYSPSLNNLENDKIEKSKLWVSLKRLFNL